VSNPSLNALRMREWRKNNPEKVRLNWKKQSLRKRYGITLEQYNTLFAKQRGLCATCSIHQSQLRRALCVDHDHMTGQIRGLLCDDCNIALGHLRDDKTTLSVMIEYLSNSESAVNSDNKDNVIFINRKS